MSEKVESVTMVGSSGASYKIYYNKLLGDGAFSKVYQCESNNTLYAVKQIKISERILPYIEQEIGNLKKIAAIPNHEHIIYYIDDFKDEDYHYIVTPIYVQGSLTNLIKKGFLNSEQEVIELFRQICYGYQFMLAANIVHRDLKTDNILVLSYSDTNYPYHWYMAVADLGSSKCITESVENTTLIGTPLTAAPEISTGVYDARVDIYSLGCILFKMITGTEPFYGKTKFEVEKLKAQTKLAVKPQFSTSLSKFTLNLISKCLQHELKDRMKPDELLKYLNIFSLYDNYAPLNLNTEETIYLMPYNGVKLPNSIPIVDNNLSEFGVAMAKIINTKINEGKVCIEKEISSFVASLGVVVSKLSVSNAINIELPLLKISNQLEILFYAKLIASSMLMYTIYEIPYLLKEINIKYKTESVDNLTFSNMNDKLKTADFIILIGNYLHSLLIQKDIRLQEHDRTSNYDIPWQDIFTTTKIIYIIKKCEKETLSLPSLITIIDALIEEEIYNNRSQKIENKELSIKIAGVIDYKIPFNAGQIEYSPHRKHKS